MLSKTSPKQSETITLVRLQSSPTCVLGKLIIGDTELSTLEPAWRNNKRNVSCIPSGDYRVTYLPRSASGKYKRVYQINSVDGRDGILIHSGNVPSQTAGCVLLGLKHGRMAGDAAVLNSRSALDVLRDHVGDRTVTIRITGDYNVVS
jgi:hypothetical protein